MENTELRIGNYVKFKKGKGCVEVFSVFEKSFYTKDEYSKYISGDPKQYQPIPLTEERLLNIENDNESFMVDKIGFVIFKNGYAYQFVREDYKYIHTLQNLFHAITGEELTIK